MGISFTLAFSHPCETFASLRNPDASSPHEGNPLLLQKAFQTFAKQKLNPASKTGLLIFRAF